MANVSTSQFPMIADNGINPDRVLIFDTTLRDGEQCPGASMNLREKLEIARQLARLNVDIIEAGFPVASEGDFQSVQQIAREIRKPQIAGLARYHVGDIDRAWEAIKEAAHPRIHTFISTSDIHLKYQLKKTRDQVMKDARAAVAHAVHQPAQPSQAAGGGWRDRLHRRDEHRG